MARNEWRAKPLLERIGRLSRLLGQHPLTQHLVAQGEQQISREHLCRVLFWFRALHPARQRTDKIAGSDFEQPKAGPEGVKGRMPGITSTSTLLCMDARMPRAHGCAGAARMLFLDEVYVERPDGSLRFRWVKAPTSAELA